MKTSVVPQQKHQPPNGKKHLKTTNDNNNSR